MTYRFAYRLNVSKTIGLGHFNRLRILSRFAGEGLFVVREEGRQILLDYGMAEQQIMVAHDTSAEWLKDCPHLSHIVADLQHQGNSRSAQDEIGALCESECHVTVIDSLPPDHFVPTRDATLPDLIVRPYHFRTDVPPPGKRWLNGAAYAVLEPRIISAREALDRNQQLAPHIMVTCGGGDPHHLSADILQRLVSSKVPITVIVGPLFDNDLRTRLHTMAKEHLNITLVENQKDLTPFYLSASLVIGQPGLTRYEAAALGRHGLYYWGTPEYLSYFNDLNKSGLGRFFHCSSLGAKEAFLGEIAALGCEVPVPVSLNKVALDLVDGKGGSRIASAIASSENTA